MAFRAVLAMAIVVVVEVVLHRHLAWYIGAIIGLAVSVVCDVVAELGLP